MNILVTIPVDQDVTARFEETAPGAAFRYVSTENVTREDIMETDILIGFVSPELIQASPRLKLFQQVRTHIVCPESCMKIRYSAIRQALTVWRFRSICSLLFSLSPRS